MTRDVSTLALSPLPPSRQGLPASFSRTAADPLTEYARDFWQRSIIFLDILRRRGNQQAEITARPINSVLIFDTEHVMSGESCVVRSTTLSCASFRPKEPRSTTASVRWS